MTLSPRPPRVLYGSQGGGYLPGPALSLTTSPAALMLLPGRASLARDRSAPVRCGGGWGGAARLSFGGER